MHALVAPFLCTRPAARPEHASQRREAEEPKRESEEWNRLHQRLPAAQPHAHVPLGEGKRGLQTAQPFRYEGGLEGGQGGGAELPGGEGVVHPQPPEQQAAQRLYDPGVVQRRLARHAQQKVTVRPEAEPTPHRHQKANPGQSRAQRQAQPQRAQRAGHPRAQLPLGSHKQRVHLPLGVHGARARRHAPRARRAQQTTHDGRLYRLSYGGDGAGGADGGVPSGGVVAEWAAEKQRELRDPHHF